MPKIEFGEPCLVGEKRRNNCFTTNGMKKENFLEMHVLLSFFENAKNLKSRDSLESIIIINFFLLKIEF